MWGIKAPLRIHFFKKKITRYPGWKKQIGFICVKTNCLVSAVPYKNIDRKCPWSHKTEQKIGKTGSSLFPEIIKNKKEIDHHSKINNKKKLC